MREELLTLWRNRLVFGTRYLDIEAIDNLADGIKRHIWPLEIPPERPNDLSNTEPPDPTGLDSLEVYDTIDKAKGKIKTLRNRLASRKEPDVFRSLELVCHYLTDHPGQSVLLDIFAFFDTPQYSLARYNGEYGMSTITHCHEGIRKSGAILYTKNIDTQYEYSDFYYQKHQHPGIVMPSSLAKYPYSNHIWGGLFPATCDIACYIRTYEGQDLPLRVLGELYLSHGCFQIKPYSIEFAYWKE